MRNRSWTCFLCGFIFAFNATVASSTVLKYQIILNVKNILSDNIEKPSITLLTFCFNILSKLPLRDNDEYYIKKVEKEGVGLAVFIGEFEDSIQSGDRAKAEILAAKFFLASDK